MKFLRILCVLGGLLVQVHALDREAFTFTSYQLDVRVEPEQQRLAVRGKIMLRNDSTLPQKNLSLQISSSLDWRSIQLDGRSVQFVSQPYTSDIDHTGALSEAIVGLPGEVPPKGTVELEIGYEGTIPLDVTRLTRIGVPEEKARHSDWDQIGNSFTAVRGIGYVAWYPVATESANLSEGNSVFETVDRWKSREEETVFRIKLNRTGEVTPSFVRCNGQSGGVQGYEQTGRAYLGWSECSFQPLRGTVPLFLAGEYGGLDKPPVNISYFAAHKSAAENYALAAQTVLPLVTEWFGNIKGRPPEARAQVMELNDPQAAPYETGSMLLMPLSGGLALAQLTAVHQLTHAAFLSPHPWIYEGLAHFAQALYHEREGGRQAALEFMALHRSAVAEAEKALAADQGRDTAASESLVNTHIEEFYRSKAMFVWWMLRDMIGDDAVKQALAAYHPDVDRSPTYMQQLIESQSRRDLQWFFNDWVNRDRDLPNFRVESAYPRESSGNAYVVTITVENRGGAGAEVPVILKMGQGQVMKRLEIRAKSKTTVRFEAASTPKEVVVNDGSVPESNMSDNLYKIEIPAKSN